MILLLYRQLDEVPSASELIQYVKLLLELFIISDNASVLLPFLSLANTKFVVIVYSGVHV